MKANRPLLLPATISCIALTAASIAAQTIINPNFDPPAEDTSDNTGTGGIGPISGWSNTGTVGVTSGTPFLNQTAQSGSHVAFTRSNASISQSVSGFDPSKQYTVTYFVSERGTDGLKEQTTSVSLNGGTTSYAQPGLIRKTEKFRRIVSGPLSVSGSTSTIQFGPGLAGDRTLLIDTVSISRAVPAVPDNGFENPVQPGTGLSGYKLGDGQGGGTLAGSAWTFGDKGGIALNLSSFTSAGQPKAPEGSQNGMLLSDNSSFSTLVSGFEAGVTYSLSFAAAGRAGAGLGPNTIQVLLNTTPLLFSASATLTPTVSGSSYTTYTTDEFTTSGGSLELKFVGLTAGDKTSFIDDIRFNFVAEASGPPAGDMKITSVTKSGNTVTVQFEGGVDGQTYNLNKSTMLDFTTPDIKDSVTLSGTTTGTLQDTSATEDKAFYRVEQQ
jgi:hypothetical protein